MKNLLFALSILFLLSSCSSSDEGGTTKDDTKQKKTGFVSLNSFALKTSLELIKPQNRNLPTTNSTLGEVNTFLGNKDNYIVGISSVDNSNDKFTKKLSDFETEDLELTEGDYFIAIASMVRAFNFEGSYYESFDDEYIDLDNTNPFYFYGAKITVKKGETTKIDATLELASQVIELNIASAAINKGYKMVIDNNQSEDAIISLNSQNNGQVFFSHVGFEINLIKGFDAETGEPIYENELVFDKTQMDVDIYDGNGFNFTNKIDDKGSVLQENPVGSWFKYNIDVPASGSNGNIDLTTVSIPTELEEPKEEDKIQLN